MGAWIVTGLCAAIVVAILVLGRRRTKHDAMAWINAHRLAQHIDGPFKPF